MIESFADETVADLFRERDTRGACRITCGGSRGGKLKARPPGPPHGDELYVESTQC